MKRSIVSLLLVLLLSLLLVGCGSVPDGRVGVSPAPIAATPALPIPSAEVSMAPVPGETAKPGTDSVTKRDAEPAASASPSPTPEAK